MTDPYCWPGTDCLANKLGLRDAAALRDAEFRLVSIRDVQAARTIIPGNYGLGHLQAFHRHLFGDLYKWAGQTRTVDISKPGARFCHWRFIDDQVSTVLTGLSEDGFLLDWSELDAANNIAACVQHLNTGETDLLTAALDPVVRRIS